MIEPTAGVQATATAGAGSAVVGDVNAHAPPLAEVKRELTELNLCGGAIDSVDAQPVIKSAGPGFTADPGTSQTEGQLPELTAQLNALGKTLGVTIYGISGYRTPAHSVAVGGYANDPHTKGEAEDIGVNSLLRSSAAQISEAELATFDLDGRSIRLTTRPIPSSTCAVDPGRWSAVARRVSRYLESRPNVSVSGLQPGWLGRRRARRGMRRWAGALDRCSARRRRSATASLVGTNGFATTRRSRSDSP